ncbi:hypothetical protein [Alkalihalobacterium alkalinitrilicum]|uniref:hypothetical protein n=1 Tax=Alkalihalobacterium alkalinitrilicum TaxID=427920 RepID=UPI001154C5E7|nr:hypothetical protein [Alkalihalobacterium alkalinitrilicum]
MERGVTMRNLFGIYALTMILSVFIVGCANNMEVNINSEAVEETKQSNITVIDEKLHLDTKELLEILDEAYYNSKEIEGEDKLFVDLYKNVYEEWLEKEEINATEEVLIRRSLRMIKLEPGDSEPFQYEYERKDAVSTLGIK